MDNLIAKLIEIVKPLIEDETIPEEERNVIIEGFEILTDETREIKERVQLSCDRFDEAQYKPYNPFHVRRELARAIASHEEFFEWKDFERSDKS